MKKYSEVSKITTEFLKGSLKIMDFQYDNDTEVVVTISYEDDFKCKNDYRVKITNMESINFLSHHGRDSYSKIPLSREVLFENALMSYLAEQSTIC